MPVPMPPITPVAPVTAPTPVAATAPLAPPTPVPAPTSVNHFQALLQQSRSNPPMLYGSGHPSTVGRLVQAEDRMMNDVLAKADHFAAQAHDMDMNSLVAGQMQLMGEMSAAMTHLTIGTSVAQGGKSAVQNLFKNQ